MPLITAPHIYAPAGWLRDHVLELEDDGTIQTLRPRTAADQPAVLDGILCPGWVNAHVHLELSHLRGLFTPGIGMAGFIREIFAARQRSWPDGYASDCAAAAMQAMLDTGTVACGDICNTALTAPLKRACPPLYTHSFVEVLGLAPERAPAVLAQGTETLAAFDGLPASLTLHAPYSVSSALVETFAGAHSPLTSIHLMESAEERALFEEQGGPIRALYEALGLPWRPAPADHPLAHILPAVAATQPGLWVHVTDMTADELGTLTTAHPHAWICLCPRSNVFLHDRLPDPIALMPYADRICLGTDSLASNTSLDMLEEIALLQTAWPDVSLHTLIRWATTGGASALQIPDCAGAFQPGTRPGVLHLSGTYGPDLTLGPDARAVRIF